MRGSARFPRSSGSGSRQCGRGDGMPGVTARFAPRRRRLRGIRRQGEQRCRRGERRRGREHRTHPHRAVRGSLPHRPDAAHREYGGDNSNSLADDNTAAYNCRRPDQTNAPVKKSPHANGRAIDINPYENPWKDLRCKCWQPSKDYARKRKGPGVITKASVPWKLFVSEGWIWQESRCRTTCTSTRAFLPARSGRRVARRLPRRRSGSDSPPPAVTDRSGGHSGSAPETVQGSLPVAPRGSASPSPRAPVVAPGSGSPPSTGSTHRWSTRPSTSRVSPVHRQPHRV